MENPTENDRKPDEHAGCAVAEGSAVRLLAEWKTALAERDLEVERRTGNMFLGPIGIEESLNIARQDLTMTMWFFNKLIAIVAQNDSPPNDGHDLRGGRSET